MRRAPCCCYYTYACVRHCEWESESNIRMHSRVHERWLFCGRIHSNINARVCINLEEHCLNHRSCFSFDRKNWWHHSTEKIHTLEIRTGMTFLLSHAYIYDVMIFLLSQLTAFSPSRVLFPLFSTFWTDYLPEFFHIFAKNFIYGFARIACSIQHLLKRVENTMECEVKQGETRREYFSTLLFVISHNWELWLSRKLFQLSGCRWTHPYLYLESEIWVFVGRKHLHREGKNKFPLDVEFIIFMWVQND